MASGIGIQSAVHAARVARTQSPAVAPSPMLASQASALNAHGLVRVPVLPGPGRERTRKLAQPLQPSRSLKATSVLEAAAGLAHISPTPPAPFGSPFAAGGAV